MRIVYILGDFSGFQYLPAYHTIDNSKIKRLEKAKTNYCNSKKVSFLRVTRLVSQLNILNELRFVLIMVLAFNERL